MNWGATYEQMKARAFGVSNADIMNILVHPPGTLGNRKLGAHEGILAIQISKDRGRSIRKIAGRNS